MRTATINKRIAKLGLEIIKNTLGGSYFYFLDIQTKDQVGESVYVFAMNQLTLDQWEEQARDRWAAREAERREIPVETVDKVLCELETADATREALDTLTNAPSGLPADDGPRLTQEEWEAQRKAAIERQRAKEQRDQERAFARAVEAIESMIPENVGFIIQRNPHALVYEDVRTHCTHMHENGNPTADEFQSPEDFEEACARNELWTMQLYPRTPVGFVTYAASSFEMLLNYPTE